MSEVSLAFQLDSRLLLPCALGLLVATCSRKLFRQPSIMILNILDRQVRANSVDQD